MRQIRVLKKEPYKIYVKYSHNDEEEWSEIDLSKRGKGRKVELHSVKQDILYPEGRKITESKKSDLMSILKFIPTIHHNFYRKLLANNSVSSEDDIDGLDEEPDFEIEKP